MSSNLRGIAFALAAMGVYATHDAVIKSLGGRVSAIQILFFASLFMVPIMALAIAGHAPRPRLMPVRPGWVAARTLSAVINGFTAFYAFTALPLAQAYALLFTMPMLVTLLAVPLLGERVGAWRLGAIVLGLCGVLIALRPGAEHLTLGHAAAIAAASCGAFTAVVGRKLGGVEHTRVLMLYPVLGNIAASAVLLPGVYAPMELSELLRTAAIAALSLSGSALILKAYRLGESATIAPMQYSQIGWGVFYGWMFFDEAPDALALLGIGVIIASGMIILWRESLRAGRRPVGR